MNKPISWYNVSRALDFYAGAGFRYVEVPWIVSHDAVAVTIPKDKTGYTTQLGSLVGSAEQSFIQLMLTGIQFHGKFMAATPCFRDDVEDEFHQSYFFKVELFVKRPSYASAFVYANELANLACDFFWTLGAQTTIVSTESGCDLELNGVEVGSYGPRMFGEHFWTYGTGIAEPRFSYLAERS